MSFSALAFPTEGAAKNLLVDVSMLLSCVGDVVDCNGAGGHDSGVFPSWELLSSELLCIGVGGSGRGEDDWEEVNWGVLGTGLIRPGRVVGRLQLLLVGAEEEGGPGN